MSGTNSPQGGLTRRSFLKTTAAIAGATALAGGAGLTALASEEKGGSGATGDQIFVQTCRGNCMNGCALDVHVRDGRIVRTSAHKYPYPEYNRICLKGLSHAESVYSPTRISWEEAIGEIIEKWTSYWNEYGTHSILAFNNPGAYSVVNGGIGSATTYRFNYLMAPTIMNNGFDRNLIYGTLHCFGSGSMWNCNQHADMLNSKTIVIWGANLPESQIQSWHFVADAMEQHGAKLVCVNPTYDAAAAKADIWVPLRPGTDGFLANAMSKYLIDQGLADEDFLANRTVAPFLLKADGRYFRASDIEETGEGADDYMVIDQDGLVKRLADSVAPQLHGAASCRGVEASTVYDLLLARLEEYSLEKAEEICSVPVDVIREVAELYATNGPAWMYQGFGCDRWRNGFASIVSICTLAMVAGQFGKPGASCGYAMFPGTEWRNYLAAYMTPEMPRGAALNINGLQLPDILEKGTFQGEPLVIKSAYVNAANPLNCMGNRKKILEAFGKIEFIVAVEIRMTDTSRYADIILPAAHWFEENDLFGSTAVHPFAQICEKAVEPVGEAKPDYEIARMIIEGMGLTNAFSGVGVDDFVAMNVLPAEQQVAPFGGVPITYERLKEEKVCAYLDPYGVYAEDGVFATPTGRAQMYLEEIAPYSFFDLEDYGPVDLDSYRWPHFEPPHEAWAETVGGYERSELSEKYPLVYFQEHQRYRTHSEFSHIPVLKELDPEPLCHISPEDASARGVANGDVVRVFNDRGDCVVKVCIDAGQRPGQVNIPKGWHADQFIGGHWQNMTGNEINPIEFNTGCFDILVEVEKYDGGEE